MFSRREIAEKISLGVNQQFAPHMVLTRKPYQIVVCINFTTFTLKLIDQQIKRQSKFDTV